MLCFLLKDKYWLSWALCVLAKEQSRETAATGGWGEQKRVLLTELFQRAHSLGPGARQLACAVCEASRAEGSLLGMGHTHTAESCGKGGLGMVSCERSGACLSQDGGCFHSKCQQQSERESAGRVWWRNLIILWHALVYMHIFLLTRTHIYHHTCERIHHHSTNKSFYLSPSGIQIQLAGNIPDAFYLLHPSIILKEDQLIHEVHTNFHCSGWSGWRGAKNCLEMLAGHAWGKRKRLWLAKCWQLSVLQEKFSCYLVQWVVTPAALFFWLLTTPISQHVVITLPQACCSLLHPDSIWELPALAHLILWLFSFPLLSSDFFPLVTQHLLNLLYPLPICPGLPISLVLALQQLCLFCLPPSTCSLSALSWKNWKGRCTAKSRA